MNHRLFHTINGWADHSWLLDHLMIFFAKYLIFGAFLLAAVCGLLLLRQRQWRPIGYLAATLVVSFVLLQVAGHVYTDKRPFETEHVHQLVAHGPGNAFPSDHTTAAAAIAFGLLFFTRFRKTGLLTLVLACLIGFARIFVGIHWPLDIAGGLLTSLVGAALVGVVYVLDRGRARRGQPSQPDHVRA